MKRHLVLVVLPVVALGCSEERATLATAELNYELASSGSRVSNLTRIKAPVVSQEGGQTNYWSQDSVREAAALVNFIEGLKQAADAYFAPLLQHCKDKVAQDPITCDAQQAKNLGLTCDEWVKQQEEYKRLVCLGNDDTAPDVTDGLDKMIIVVDFLEQEALSLGRTTLDKEIALAKEITANMQNKGSAPPYRDWGMGPSPGARFDASTAGAPSGGGNLGATPGGAQDIGYLRTVVKEGYVPLAVHLAADGLFSEHHLPIESSVPCNQLLCVRAATGLAPAIGSGKPSYFVQLGFSSNLRADTFKRAPVNLAVVLDKSGSMSGPAADNLSKMEAVKQALSRMVDKLDSHDRLAIVLFNSSYSVALPSTPVKDRAAIKAIIDTMAPGGGTNIESGLKKGFEIVAANSAPSERLDRVMLLTDALPNVGLTGEGSFLSLTESYAKRDIGLTTFGVGINFGQELVLAISRIRGGNYFFLEDGDRIKEVFDLDFDYLVTPLAYDMHMQLKPFSWLRTVGVHGIPGWKQGNHVVTMDVETLFLSRKHGAIVIQLEPVDAAPVVQ